MSHLGSLSPIAMAAILRDLARALEDGNGRVEAMGVERRAPQLGVLPGDQVITFAISVTDE